MLSQKIKISNNTKELILTELKLESTIAHFVIKYTQKLGKHDITCGYTFTKNRYLMYIISEADDRDGRCRSVQDKENYMHHL